MTPRAAAPAFVLALVAVAGLAAPAGASTIAGKVAGGKIPKAGKGFAAVRAVGVGDLVISDIGKVRAGRYKLTVPAGRYWLYAATTPFRGKAGVDRGAGIVKLRKGKRKTERVSLRKPKKKAKRPKIPGLPVIPKLPERPPVPSASAAFVNVKHPAVWVQHFTVSGGDAELRVLKKGLADMLITDILDPLKTACNGVVVEREHFDQILAEILLSQSPLADPSTRMTTARIIQHNRVVTGGLTVAGGMMTLTVNITNVATGAVRTVSRSTTPDRFFELEQSVVQEVVRLICGDEPPAAYTGQASGSTSGESGSSRQTISWSGNVRLRFNGDVIGAVGNDPPGEYAYYEPESGGIHMIVDGAEGECTYHGEADATIVPSVGEGGRVQQGVDEPSYAWGASLPLGASVRVTTVGPEHCGGGDVVDFPMAGRVFLNTLVTQRSSSTSLAGTAEFPIGHILTKWAWSLAPQAN